MTLNKLRVVTLALSLVGIAVLAGALWWIVALGPVPGFDGKHTIGVWVGRPDGAPMPGLVGRTAAAPILFDAFARIGGPVSLLPRPPAGVLVTSNARLPPPLRRFQPGRLAGETMRPPLRILFPPDGAWLDLSTTDGKPDPVGLKVAGAVAPLTVLVNGVPVAGEGRGSLFFNPDGPGFSRVTVMDAAGATDSIVVRVDDGPVSAPASAAPCAPALCGEPTRALLPK